MKLIIFIILLTIIFLGGYIFVVKHNSIKDKYLLLSNKYFFIKYILLGISFFILSIGIFDIKWGEKDTKTENKGIDIVFVLDVSKSMNALDFHDNKYLYSRLNASKSMISNFVVKHPNDRFGLIIFAGDVSSVSPLTLDHDTFLTFLNTVDYKNLNKQGTNIEDAISSGIQRFNTSKDRSKVMIIISDGGDKETTIDTDFLKKISKNKDINSFVVGIGSEQGAKIPLGQDPFGRIQYQTYKGREVITRLNKDNLKKINKAINGKYITIDTLEGLGNFDKEINKLKKNKLKNGLGEEKIDGSRKIGILSYIFFIMYIIYYLNENYLIRYINTNENKQ